MLLDHAPHFTESYVPVLLATLRTLENRGKVAFHCQLVLYAVDKGTQAKTSCDQLLFDSSTSYTC